MITLTEPTINFLPSFNRINFDISSDNATATGFKFAVKIYNADTGTLVTTAYYDPAPLPFSAITFDVSRFLIEGYQWQNLFPETGEWKFNECILNRFYLKCYEYYDVLGNGIYEIDPATEVISNTYTCFAGSFNFFDRPEWDDNRYNGEADSYYPLTDEVNFQLHQDFFKVFTFYDPNDYITSIGISRIDNTGSTNYSSIKPLNAGGDSLTHFTFIPVDWGATDQTIQFNLSINYTNPLGVQSEQFATITLFDCKKYEVKNIVWINRFGGLDSYSFILANRKSTQVEKKQYQRDYTDYGQTFIDPYNIFQNTSPTYYTKEIQKITINTEYLTDRESIIFRQLYSSPLIYLYAKGDYLFNNAEFPEQSFIGNTHSAFIPVKLNANAYEIKQKQNEKLYQIEAELEYSEPSYRQIT
jgi:hypothetical protein